ncbi:GNAT family N-acetyltransferase [Congregibacter litoralis]|uniref:Acetyltransferase n=1 Tax=Congregibacter litoralis KT71 TaxID=314285 RepID=A4ABI5_9GAMM|nr:GNAT family N-acetyltransferase [Congregibacter litoralis]EAQ96739.1 Acetyltransferase [Congregibacter litoralis KT71]
MSTVPQILTERLCLRGHCEQDHPAATAIWQHPGVYTFITGAALSAQDVWMRLLRYGGLWDMLGYGYWAVEERASGKYIGQLGFADFKRGLPGFDGHYPEAGWVLHPDAAGKGYATEGMAAACQWLDEQGGRERSFCIISADNPRSVRVAAKIGYRFALTSTLGDEEIAVYFRDRTARRDTKDP